MLVESPIGSIAQQSQEPIDWLDLTWEECGRRALTKQTRNGKTVRILLKLGVTVKHLDLLWRDQSGAVAVNLLPSEVLVAEPTNPQQAICLSYKLGDLHLAMEIAGREIICIDDGPVQAVLEELDIPYRIETRRFQPTYRSSVALMSLAENFEVVRT